MMTLVSSPGAARRAASAVRPASRRAEPVSASGAPRYRRATAPRYRRAPTASTVTASTATEQEAFVESSVTFRCEQRMGDDEVLHIVGSTPELGDWDLENAKPLQWGKDMWYADLLLPVGQLQFKLAVRKPNGTWFLEEGANRVMEVESSPGAHQEAICSWLDTSATSTVSVDSFDDYEIIETDTSAVYDQEVHEAQEVQPPVDQQHEDSVEDSVQAQHGDEWIGVAPVGVEIVPIELAPPSFDDAEDLVTDIHEQTKGNMQVFLDATECSTHYSICVDLPDVHKEHVKVRVEERVTYMLTISIKRERIIYQTDDKWHISERPWGEATRVLKLPFNSDVSRMTAKLENGVLDIKIPKLDAPNRDYYRAKISKPTY